MNTLYTKFSQPGGMVENHIHILKLLFKMKIDIYFLLIDKYDRDIKGEN